MVASQFVELNTSAKMPTVGLGTWKSKPGEVEHAVAHALMYGYRSIDTAAAYSNESEVGLGIAKAASTVPRSSFFLTTKLEETTFADPEAALHASLAKLNTTYLDLWLMHWPAPMKDGKADKSIDWLDTWKTMVKLYEKYPEKIKAIGVSNFSVKFLTRLLDETAPKEPGGSTVIPAVNQIELHPSCPQQDVVDFCVARGIIVTAYSPLGSDDSPLLGHEIVNRIAKKHNVGPGTVLISLQANRKGVNVLTKSVKNSRIESNFTIIDLSDEEIAELHSIDKEIHFRACHPNWTGWGSLGFPDCAESGKGYIRP